MLRRVRGAEAEGGEGVMGRRATFTEAQMRRAVKVGREIDPQSVIEVTLDGTHTAPEPKQAARNEVDNWFEK